MLYFLNNIKNFSFYQIFISCLIFNSFLQIKYILLFYKGKGLQWIITKKQLVLNH